MVKGIETSLDSGTSACARSECHGYLQPSSNRVASVRAKMEKGADMIVRPSPRRSESTLEL